MKTSFAESPQMWERYLLLLAFILALTALVFAPMEVCLAQQEQEMPTQGAVDEAVEWLESPDGGEFIVMKTEKITDPQPDDYSYEIVVYSYQEKYTSYTPETPEGIGISNFEATIYDLKDGRFRPSTQVFQEGAISSNPLTYISLDDLEKELALAQEAVRDYMAEWGLVSGWIAQEPSGDDDETDETDETATTDYDGGTEYTGEEKEPSFSIGGDWEYEISPAYTDEVETRRWSWFNIVAEVNGSSFESRDDRLISFEGTIYEDRISVDIRYDASGPDRYTRWAAKGIEVAIPEDGGWAYSDWVAIEVAHKDVVLEESGTYKGRVKLSVSFSDTPPPPPPGGITSIGDLPGPDSWPQAATGILLPPLFGTLMGIIYILFGGGTTPPRGVAAPPAGPDLQSITDIPYEEVQFPDAGAVLSTAVQESTGGGVPASKEALGTIPALKDIFDRGIYTAVYFGEGVLKDIASLGTDFMAGSFILSTLARRQIERGPAAIMDDALDWVGDTVNAGIDGALDLLPDSGPVAEVLEDAWRGFRDVNEKAVDVFSHIIRAPVEDPVSFASSLVGKDNWGKVIDPDVPFSERLGRVVYGSVDLALTIEGVSQVYKGVAKGAGKEALERAGGIPAGKRAATGADSISDVEKGLRASEATKAASAERKTAYESIKEAGKRKVDDLEGAYKNMSPEDAADVVSKNTRKQVIECLGDNQSKYEINMRTGEEAARIRGFVEKEANKITSEAGEAARKKLAENIGLNADDIKVRTYTNPRAPGEARVPLDADVTFQRRARKGELIRDPDSPGGWRRAEGGADEWVDIPAKDAQPVYNETLYETSGGKEYFPDMSADDFARKLDHNVTDSRHLEAFPEFERLTTGARVLDSDGVSKVMGYKYYKEAAEAAKVSNPALAEDLLMKGMRQTTKAYEKQVSKIQVLSEKGAGGRVPRVPPRLEEAVKGMDKMIRANASPAEIEAYLKSIGYTTDKVAEQVGGIYDAVNKVWRTM